MRRYLSLALAALALAAAVAATACRDPDESGTTDWTVRAVSYAHSGKCSAAFGVLEEQQEQGRQRIWYSLWAASSQLCWSKTGRHEYLAKGLAVNAEGIKRYPSASALWIDRALMLLLMGRPHEAIEAYESARQAAERNLKVLPDGPEAEEERTVMKRASRDIERLRSQIERE